MQEVDIDYESKFIQNFVNKSRQSRVLFELSKEKKRSECIRSFSEFHKQYLQRSKLHMLSEKVCIPNVIDAARSKGYNNKTPMYILHFNEEYDRTRYPLDQALSMLWFSGPCIMISGDGKFAFCILEMGQPAFSRALLY